VEGLDAILIGPYDLSASIGLTAQFDHPRFLDLIQKIKKSADSVNIPCGMHVVDPRLDELQSKIDSGYRFLAYSIDAVFISKNVINPI